MKRNVHPNDVALNTKNKKMKVMKKKETHRKGEQENKISKVAD